MKRFIVLLLAAILVLSIAGCSEKIPDDSGKISIVATAFPHYDFARQITKGVDNVELKMLVSPGNEVHAFEPSPSDILAISACDMFIFTGGESDTWVKGILDCAKSNDAKIVSFMDICSPDGKEGHVHHEHEDEHEDDVYDEHVWTLPLFAEAISEHICRILCEIDPENAAVYDRNLQEFLEKTSYLDREFSKILSDSQRDLIVVADRFPFYHLASYYKLDYLSAYPGCASSTEPSASVIAQLSDKVKTENIPYVFTIEFSNQKIAGNIISGTNCKILTLHSCHTVSADDFDKGITYYDLMLQNSENLRKALCE